METYLVLVCVFRGQLSAGAGQSSGTGNGPTVVPGGGGAVLPDLAIDRSAMRKRPATADCAFGSGSRAGVEGGSNAAVFQSLSHLQSDPIPGGHSGVWRVYRGCRK